VEPQAQSQPRVAAWRIVAWVLSGVVVIVTFVAFLQRSVENIESGEVLRGAITLVILIVGLSAIAVVSIVAFVMLKRRGRATRGLPDREE